MVKHNSDIVLLILPKLPRTVEDRKVRAIKVLAARMRRTQEAENNKVQSRFSRCRELIRKFSSSTKRKRVLQSVHLSTVEDTVGVHTVYLVKRKKMALKSRIVQ